MTPKYAVDTQVFNWIRDFGFELSAYLPAQFFISAVQAAELQAAKDAALLNLVEVWVDDTHPAESFVFGAKGLGFGQWKWSDGVTYERILEALNSANRKANNVEDALIGEHAIKNGLILLTGDKILAETMSSLGAQVRFIEHPSKSERGATPCAATTRP
ncbi:hypothetical protein LMG26684_01698 [Achromobacter mucicolens]|uniref:hypothetical protein n=1 Tax=Achromobacter mucicolens TaxID=1389922 RepID=UPI001467908E|nr:hypothetical protein [Achromobacter mucicolens]CAB3843505.1 hypothetical protein LMG26684_01698 [Achromobacter mucicolens]